MPGRHIVALSGSEGRYGFNGKEKDDDIQGQTVYDYGFRIYNPALGKFLSVDPLTTFYPWYSPYHFAGNNPIHNIDLDGLEECGYGQKLENQWIPALGSGKMTEAQFERNKMAFSIGGTVGLAFAATVYTGGKAAPFFGKLFTAVTLYHVVSAFPHNGASTPEGQAQQGKENKEHLARAFLWWGGGVVANKIIGAVVNIVRGPIKEAVKYLFRGTSKGYSGSPAVQELMMTPTSSDPGVATIFSVNSKNFGDGILQVALPENLQGVKQR